MNVNGKREKAKRRVPFLFLPLSFCLCLSQSYPHFNVHLTVNYDSAERCLGLYEGLSGSGRHIASLRGSQIALATTADLARRSLTTERLESSLDGIKFGQVDADDVFGLKDARQNVAMIKDLLTTIKRRNFAQRVISTVEQLFPAGTSVASTIPIYFVAFGHQTIDAYVRRVVWHGDVPQFVGEGEGELTIVVNLAKAVSYGRTVDERYIGVLSVVAHEVFHAAFGAYKDSSSVWQSYYARRNTYLDQLLDLTQNEGIAHYLTFEQRTGGVLPPDWDEKIAASFVDFNAVAEELTAPHITPNRAHSLISNSNTSGYWKSYGAITGMFIARTIDQTLGRGALAETIERGVDDFYRKYAKLCESERRLPRLTNTITSYLPSDR